MEATVRSIHCVVGIYLAGFLVLQVITGLFFALATLLGLREVFSGRRDSP